MKESVFIDYFDIIQLPGKDILESYLLNHPDDERISLLRNQNNDVDLDTLSIERTEMDYFKFFGIERFEYIINSRRFTDLGLALIRLVNRNVNVYLNMNSVNIADDVKRYIALLVDGSENLHFINVDDDYKLTYIKDNNISVLVTSKICSIEQIITNHNVELLIPLHGYNFKRDLDNDIMPLDESIFSIIKENNVPMYIGSLINRKTIACG